MEKSKEAYNQALKDVHSELADFYDECLEKNEVNAKKNISIIVRNLKERIDNLKQKQEVTGNSSPE